MGKGFLVAALAAAIFLGQPAGAQLDATVPSDTYRTIQEGIDAAAGEIDGGTITVRTGTYGDALTLRAGVTVRGEETASTILTGAITSQGGGTLQRFTVRGNGASFSNAPNLDLSNNVFHSVSGAALQVRNSANVAIANNTFYGNGTGLTLTGSTGSVRANLFANNAVAVSWDNAGASFQQNFFDLRAQDVTEETTADRDPLLVAPEAGDFHLRAGSPCIAAASNPDGSDADQGAYGGTGADTRPFPVSGLDAEVDATGTAATLTWQPNLAYDVTGYRVHYGPDENFGGTGADQGASPITVGLVAGLALTGLDVAAEAPGAVGGLEAFPRNRAVLLRWDPAPGATGYRVLWGTATGALDEASDVGNVTSHTVTGLANGTEYRFAVRSLGGTTHNFAVAALATARESVRSAGVAVPVTELEGDLSAEVLQIPEEAVGFPELDDRGGCFLRSAAGPPRGGAVFAGACLLAVFGLLSTWRARAVLSVLVLVGVALGGGEARADGLQWTASAKGGVWFPAESGWDDHYDSAIAADWRLAFGLRLLSRFEVGLEGGYRKTEGEVDTNRRGDPLGRTLEQTLTVFPVQAYVVYDLRGAPDALVVPYVGAGYSRYYYRHEVEEASTVRGRQHGYHVRGGVKVLLNPFDPAAARRSAGGMGPARTYACLEGQYARVDDFGSADADLGGWSLLAGAALYW
ncbi:MAG: fibronectin type III domain-containing protein [Thermodesulfobacteriota bacterium]